MSREIEDLGFRLEEAGGVNSNQAEVNRRREAELSKLKRDFDVVNTNHEQELLATRNKSNAIIQDLNEQIEQLNKVKSK